MIKMKNNDRTRRSVWDFALHCAVRRTLKSATGFLTGAPGLVILLSPPDVKPSGYVIAVCTELYGDGYGSQRDFLGSMTINDDDKHDHILGRFDTECRLKMRAIIVAANRDCVPEEIKIAADAILDIEPVSPSDLQAACRAVLEVEATLDQAAEALTFPTPLLTGALRLGRKMEIVLQRLREAPPLEEQAAPPKPSAKTGKLEAMHGYGRAKEWGLQLASDLEQWKKGRLSWDDVDKGVLLSGPPGVGKTAFAKALAAQCDLPLIATSLGQWQAQGHLGDLLKAMRRDFQKAKDRAPSILMIDELDSLGDRQKFTHDNSSYSIQVVNALLECLDGVGGRDGVVIIGATNHPSKIDPAILRAGRFDNHIEIERPDKASRIAIIEGYLDMKIATSERKLIASQSSGLSGADLAKACRDARRTARIQKRAVNAADVVACLPRLVKIDKDQRRTIAVHEAGHTLVGIKLGIGTFQGTMVADWIDPNEKSQPIGAARFSFPELCGRDRQQYLDRICMFMAGIAAEVVEFGKHMDGAGLGEGTDLEMATTLATSLEAQSGVGSRFRYSRIASAEDGEDLRRRDPELAARIEEILATQFERAKEIILGHRDYLKTLENELFIKGVIDPTRGYEILSPCTDCAA